MLVFYSNYTTPVLQSIQCVKYQTLCFLRAAQKSWPLLGTLLLCESHEHRSLHFFLIYALNGLEETHKRVILSPPNQRQCFNVATWVVFALK